MAGRRNLQPRKYQRAVPLGAGAWERCAATILPGLGKAPLGNHLGGGMIRARKDPTAGATVRSTVKRVRS
jgi:hypothetical protein